MNRELFFGNLKKLGLFKQFTQLQVNCIDAILNECEKEEVTDVRHIAYIFATAYHECYNPEKPSARMTPMEEFGGKYYLQAKKYYPFYGRGFSQLTWRANYELESKRLGLDLLREPELLLEPGTAANSHVHCMKNGAYTGKKLSDFINDEVCDYTNARRIVNGNKKGELLPDKAELIAGYAQKFFAALHST